MHYISRADVGHLMAEQYDSKSQSWADFNPSLKHPACGATPKI